MYGIEVSFETHIQYVVVGEQVPRAIALGFLESPLRGKKPRNNDRNHAKIQEAPSPNFSRLREKSERGADIRRGYLPFVAPLSQGDSQQIDPHQIYRSYKPYRSHLALPTSISKRAASPLGLTSKSLAPATVKLLVVLFR
jgi:hypothetical protein